MAKRRAGVVAAGGLIGASRALWNSDAWLANPLSPASVIPRALWKALLPGSASNEPL